MDAIDILGELLGRKTSKPGRGTDVLKDIFTRGSRKSSTASTSAPPKSQSDINREAQQLEDLLNVAQDRHSKRKPQSTQSNARPKIQTVPPRTSTTRRDINVGGNRELDNERAVVLIQAMVNAAKADGEIDVNEQHKIIEKLGGASRESIDFLRKAFAAPLNVQEFVQSVPIGMEQQVYTISLIAIDLDEEAEASYLMQLADGLRIPVGVRKQIHQRLGAPSIY